MSSEEDLINLIHSEVARYMHRSTRRTPVAVDGYDPETHAVKLKLMPESMDGEQPVVTGWVPLHTAQTGNNFGWYTPPYIGDHGWLEFADFDREGGTFTHAVFNDKFKPDKTVKAGENKYRHRSGTLLYFADDGTVTLQGMNNTNANGGTNTAQGGGSDNSKQTIVLKPDGSVFAQDKSGNANFNMDGSGNVVFNCIKFTVNASGDIKLISATNALLKGAAAILYATGNAFMRAVGSTNIKGTSNLADPPITTGAAEPPISS